MYVSAQAPTTYTFQYVLPNTCYSPFNGDSSVYVRCSPSACAVYPTAALCAGAAYGCSSLTLSGPCSAQAGMTGLYTLVASANAHR